SGGGIRRLTSAPAPPTACASSCSASMPAVQPPFPLPSGPFAQCGIVNICPVFVMVILELHRQFAAVLEATPAATSTVCGGDPYPTQRRRCSFQRYTPLLLHRMHQQFGA